MLTSHGEAATINYMNRTHHQSFFNNTWFLILVGLTALTCLLTMIISTIIVYTMDITPTRPPQMTWLVVTQSEMNEILHTSTTK